MKIMLNCLCSLLLLPNGMVCALFGIKNLLDPWFTDEVWGPTAPPQLNPRIFLFRNEWGHVRTYGCCSSAVLQIGRHDPVGWNCGSQWQLDSVSRLFLFLLCSVALQWNVLCLGHTLRCPKQSEIAPIMFLCSILCLVTTGLRAFVIADDPYDAPPYTSSLFLFGLVLVVMSVAQTFVMSRNAAKAQDSIAKFHAIEQHFLGNGMIWSKGKQYPVGYLDENALLGKA